MDKMMAVTLYFHSFISNKMMSFYKYLKASNFVAAT